MIEELIWTAILHKALTFKSKVLYRSLAELFILIWRSMYDLVYHKEDSRIAEKMLEKAIIRACEDNRSFKDNFKNLDKFLELNDDKLLSELENSLCGFSKKIAKQIRARELFKHDSSNDIVLSDDIENENFLENLTTKGEENLSDELSLRLSKKVDTSQYEVICDIILWDEGNGWYTIIAILPHPKASTNS